MSIYEFVKPALFRFDPERVHDLAMAALSLTSHSSAGLNSLERLMRYEDPRLRTEVLGISFENPLGIAAGLDKNGVAVPALMALGFGSVEIGTVTPKPQSGNPKPRVFRLPKDAAIINRMGFPGEGVEAVRRNLASMTLPSGMLGCNIGPNKTSVAAGTADEDCALALQRLHHLASYFVVNVSSPNTAELRKLQGKDALRHLLTRVMAARPAGSTKPVLVKIAPDLTDHELDEILEVVAEVKLDGIVATNTTIARPESLTNPARSEAGGLSGAPLRERSLAVVSRIHRQIRGGLPIIAVGGIFTGRDAVAAVAAGASLVQTYTGFIYRGPAAARMIKQEMSHELDRLGANSLDEIRGTFVG